MVMNDEKEEAMASSSSLAEWLSPSLSLSSLLPGIQILQREHIQFNAASSRTARAPWPLHFYNGTYVYNMSIPVHF